MLLRSSSLGRPAALYPQMCSVIKNKRNGNVCFAVGGILVDVVKKQPVIGAGSFVNLFLSLLAIECDQDGVVKGGFSASVQPPHKRDIPLADFVYKAHFVSAFVDTKIMKFNFSKIHTPSP